MNTYTYTYTYTYTADRGGRISPQECKKDVLFKLMTETCHLRDPNPKVALLTLQVLQLFMRLHPEVR